MIKVALIGYGKMGKAIASLAASEGIEIVAILDSSKEITEKNLGKAEICIDFSHPMAVVKNIEKVAQLKRSIVIGTTGWLEKIEEVRALVERYQIGALYAENFSIGMLLFEKIVSYAASLISAWPEYDIGLYEAHHRHKVDSPSGSAKMLAETILHQMKETKERVAITSERLGSIPGTHKVQMDSPIDTITLTHEARSREGFARGALLAAKWLHKKQGLFHLKDFL